jgi:uncharacterized protein YjbJ (UPF0337 family)
MAAAIGRCTRKEIHLMNRDQAERKVNDVAGKAQCVFDSENDDGSQQIRGGAKQVEGKVQQGNGGIRPRETASLASVTIPMSQPRRST